MGKSTAEEAAITRQKILDAALQLTLTVGFDKASFVAIAKAVPMSPSGINTHFPRKSDIARELEPTLAKMLLKPLNFDSCDSFYDSWINALDCDNDFKASVMALGPIVPAKNGIAGLVDRIECDDKEEARATVHRAIGYSVEFFSQ